MGRSGTRSPRAPGRAPLFLRQKEVDALYDTAAAVGAALTALRVAWLGVAGTALGAVRSRSVLFCDDDVDVAVVGAEAAEVVRSRLQAELGPRFVYVRRPWPACDKVRPTTCCSHVWVDIFVLRRYACEADVLDVLIEGRHGDRGDVAVPAALREHVAPYPLWAYDCAAALSRWPSEYLTSGELWPLRRLAFGPVEMPVPNRVKAYLERAFSTSCFEERPLASPHGEWQPEFAGRGDPDAEGYVALEDEDFLPVNHSLRAKRPKEGFTRERLLAWLAEEDRREVERERARPGCGGDGGGAPTAIARRG